MVMLKTTCEGELWAGFFGINANGDQPECDAEITIEVEEDCTETDKYGNIRPSFSVECPKCHRDIDWPQEWEVVEDESQRI
jgi:hypothetical protein